jgi:hypothetical protein
MKKVAKDDFFLVSLFNPENGGDKSLKKLVYIGLYRITNKLTN